MSAFPLAIWFDIVVVPLQSLSTDEKTPYGFNGWRFYFGNTIRHFGCVFAVSLFLKKIFHCWLELFLLQLNSILLLCLWLCLYDLSFLEKYQLYRLALFQCAIWFDIVGVSLHFQFLSNVDLWKCSKIQGVWQEASFVEKALVFQLHGDAQLGFKGPVAIPGSCSGAFSIEKAKPM